MSLQQDREQRSHEEPVVGGLAEVPGIVAAMSLSPGLAVHLRGLADELLVNEYPGSSLTRVERELIATAVSAENECFYCMDSHGAFALALMGREAPSPPSRADAVVESVKAGDLSCLSPKVRALVEIARVVRRRARDLTREDVVRALEEGATDADTQLAVLIASAFSMYNRMVDGLRARTPPSPRAYAERAGQIAEHGYSDRRVAAIPR